MPPETLERRDLAAERPLVEALVGRVLRRAEQAIDVLRLDDALNQAKDDLEAAIRAEMIRGAKAWADGHTPAVYLNVTQEMLDILDELSDIGAAEGVLELERLGYVGLRSPGGGRRYITEETPPGRDLRSFLHRNVLAIAARIQDEHLHTDLAGVSEQAVANALLSTPGARDLASRVVSTALIDGLGQTWDENEDLVGGWEYTAILDSGTCDVCAPLDGTQYATLEELFLVLPDFGPNPECLGGGRCRCRAVPLPAGGSPAQAAPSPDPVLLPPAATFDDRLGGSAAAADVRAGLAAAAAVHHLPEPSRDVPLELDPDLPPGVGGGYNTADVSISLNPDARFLGFTLVHELGHYIDHMLIGEPGVPASYPGTPELDDWRDAVVQTWAADGLARIAADPAFDVLPGPEPGSTFRQYVREYLLTPHELFARSYSQYIAEKSGDRDLLAALADAQTLPYPEQWDDDDFAPIRAAFDRLLEGLGWRTTR